jgi:serine/threonine-protein kinase
MPLSVGDKIGHYEVLSLLGAGGMGEVYKARDTTLKRDVALKVLPATFLRDPERMARFQREAQVLASLDHPNIGHIYGIVDAEDSRGLVLALIEGPTLADRIEAGPVPQEEAIAIAKQIIEALEYAHDRGVVHRDLKPANVKITPEGVVKVLDFGLAKVLEDEPPASSLTNSPTLTVGSTRAGVILGTAAYMSPEQAVGRPVDRRSDIFSFGAVLYEMLAGKRAFAGTSTPDVLEAVVKNEPDWSALPPNTPPYRRKLLERALAKDRKLRLQAIGEARLVLANPPAATEPADDNARFISSKPWVMAAAVFAALAVGASLLAWRATRPVDHPLMRLSVDLGPEAVAGGNTTVILSLDGTRIVFPIRGLAGTRMLATRTLDQPKATPMPGTEGGSDPFFSPDGQWIGFFASGKLKKVSVQGGAAVVLCDVGVPRGGSWGEDGYIVFSPLNAGPLMRIPKTGGTPEPLTKLTETEATQRWPQVLPGGKAVLFTANSRQGDYENAYINVFVLKTGEVKTIQRGGYFGRFLPSPQGGGYLLYLHEGTLFAAPFDSDRLETGGSAVPVLDDAAGDPIGAGGQFDWSQNGSLVYLSGKTGGATYPIVWMDSSGKTTPLLAKPNGYGAPRFSPDGKRLAFTSPGSAGTDVWVYDWERDTPTQLTFTGPGNREIAWTPDGKHIVFCAGSGQTGSLWWTRSDGSGEPQKLLEMKNSGIGLRPQSFTPDGRRLAFDQNVLSGVGVDIYTLPLDLSDPDRPKPGTPEPFLATPTREVDAAFSPDGHWMAYASNESGVDDVFVRPFPGPGGKWRVSTGGGKFPTWSRTGREIFFLGGDDRIMVSEYTVGGDSFSPGKPRAWSDRQVLRPTFIRTLDLHPDGKRFAVFERPVSDQTTGNLHVTFVLNFADELRRRVPTGK